MVSTRCAKRVYGVIGVAAVALGGVPLNAIADTVINSYDNTGKTFVVDSTTGNVILENGPFTGGTISTRDGFYFRSHYGTLTAVTLDGRMISAYGTMARNLTLSAGSVISIVSRLDIGIGTIPGDEQVINGTGEIVFNFSEDFFDGLHDYNSHVTVGPAITIRTGSSDGKIRMQNFVNQGTISAETAGKRLMVQYNPSSTYSPLPWRNDGLLRARNGATLSLFGEIPVGG